jgi:uncharacterized membrane protein YeaQ/YmgE (transglycosylase-associated protein family)
VVSAVIFWIVLGLIIGYAARWIVPGEAPVGVATDIFLGIVGAIIGGWSYGRLQHVDAIGFNLPSMVCALIGAVVSLWLLRVVRGRAGA